jgi:hypothetical protein
VTSGSRLKMVGLSRSVGGFHSVQAVVESSRLSLSICSPGLPDSEANDAQVDSWRGCFMMSWLCSDFFPRGTMTWMG